MRSLEKPNDDVKDIFLECISNIRDEEYKSKLADCAAIIDNKTKEFELKKKDNHLYKIQPHIKVGTTEITNIDMKKIYTNKLVKGAQPGRKYYDKYIIAAKNGICPLCGQREVSTLDHYLPKMKYPSLAVSPINLIPSCIDCNKGKNDKVFRASEEETLHPYYDNIEDVEWLYAKVTEKIEPIITFEVRRPDSWNDLLFNRVKTHFNEFKINKLYSTQAAVEISGIKFGLVKVYNKRGAQGVKEELNERFESYSMDNLNSWKTAMYRSLSQNDWVCNEWLST